MEFSLTQGSGWDNVGALRTGQVYVRILNEITKALSNDVCTLLCRYKFSCNFHVWPCKMSFIHFILRLLVCRV